MPVDMLYLCLSSYHTDQTSADMFSITYFVIQNIPLMGVPYIGSTFIKYIPYKIGSKFKLSDIIQMYRELVLHDNPTELYF